MRVLLRADLNVPLDKGTGQITDDWRIRSVVPTIQYLVERGAIVVVMSHLGRPGGHMDASLSLAPVADRLAGLLGKSVNLLPLPEHAGGTGMLGTSEGLAQPVMPTTAVQLDGPEWPRQAVMSEAAGQQNVDRAVEAIQQLGAGSIVLLENLRFDPGEEANDSDFAQNLASLGDFYVNDAFGASHRHHSSIDSLCRLMPHSGGLLLEAETRALDKLLANPPKPFVAVLGGAKVSDKLGLIESLLDKIDLLLIGGAMCFSFIKARGGSVGESLYEPDFITAAAQIEEHAKAMGKHIVLPADVNCIRADLDGIGEAIVHPADAIPDGYSGRDIGPYSVEVFSKPIHRAGSILWNGPMGVFEQPPFDQGTRGVATAVANSGAYSVVGGGDSVAALRSMNLADRVSHLSTGGGAALEYIEKGDLPGLVALREPQPNDA